MTNIAGEWLLQHGWGFTHECWENWSQFIPPQIQLKPLERGYFGNTPCTQEFTHKASCKVLVAHSFGLHIIPKQLFQMVDVLVIIAGFISLHTQEQKNNQKSQIAIHAMLKRLQEKPKQLLEKFYQNCFYPLATQKPPPPCACHKMLVQDLDSLNNNPFALPLIQKIPKILLFYGMRDLIVPLQAKKELHFALAHSKLMCVEEGGHMLPITHAELCCRTIIQELCQ